jgi:hypothetical protein
MISTFSISKTCSISKTTVAALAAAVMSAGIVAWSAPAEARPHGGGFHRGGMAFHGGGFHRGFARPAFAGRAAFFHGRHFHRGRFFWGGPAVALALGAPYYNNYYYDGGCYPVWRRYYDPWGYVVTRRVMVCS